MRCPAPKKNLIMENRFDEKQSLQVIGAMIAQAQNRIEKGAGKYFLLWGYVIALASVAHYVWVMFGTQSAAIDAGLLWGVATLAGLAGTLILVLGDRRKKEAYVRTYTDTVGNGIWMGFCVCALAISVLMNGKYGAFIYPAISFIYTYALFLSAQAFRFRWMYWCVAVCAVCVIAYRFLDFVNYPLLMGAIMVAGNVLPGHIINHKARRRV